MGSLNVVGWLYEYCGLMNLMADRREIETFLYSLGSA